MFILHASSEIAPFAKTGGLGDVVGGIARPLAKLGHRVAAVMPLYRRVRDARVPMKAAAEFDVKCGEATRRVKVHRGEMPGAEVFFVEQNDLFDREGLYGGGLGDYPDNAERFSLFCRAVLRIVTDLRLPVDIVHAHDWQTALLPVYLRTSHAADPALARIRTLFTIHNLAYQGLFPSHFMHVAALDWSLFNWKQLEFWGSINFMKGGLVFADRITTVSPRYAQEIQSREHGCGLEGVLKDRAADLSGILNGVDTEEWNPGKDKLIPQRFSAGDMRGKAACRAHLRRRMGLPESPAPLFGVVTRLAAQKGIDLLVDALAELVGTEAQFAVLGSGDDGLQRALVAAAQRWPRQVAVQIGFDDRLAHEITAGADALLMPSRWEPCGLSQMYAQLYGTLPVVRRTGGLADSVEDRATGFVFDEASPAGLILGVRRAIEAWRNPPAWAAIVQAAMKLDWSWDRSAREYAALYAKLVAPAGPEAPGA
ncbi:MAG: glycogen synthase GlgA [Planctomycetia bacterium]|nr:glycogen synthase GlgA [Planctomycetia bacterium]